MSTPELDWFKSSYSSAQGDSCIEIAVTEQAVQVRDSKDVTRPHFSVCRGSWFRFIRYAAES